MFRERSESFAQEYFKNMLFWKNIAENNANFC